MMVAEERVGRQNASFVPLSTRTIRKGGQETIVSGTVNHNRPGSSFCRGVGEKTWRLDDLVDDFHKGATDVLAGLGAGLAEAGSVLFC